MTGQILSAAALVHVAGLLHLAGYLSRDQLVLRLFLFLGTSFYIAYYFFSSAAPMWAAISWSSFFMVANLYMMVTIFLDRRHYTLAADEKRLASAFTTMTPGQFRRLLKGAKWFTPAESTLLTREGEHPDALYFVLDGSVTISKGSRRFGVAPGLFIGEIAWLLGTPATATVEVGAGARYVEWDAASLRAILTKDPHLRLALESLLNRDLADKLGKS